MSLQIRRGTDAERLTITPLTAELIYTTDTQLVYVGDGVTVGGILVGDGGGNGTYGNANVVALLGSGVAGDIIPVGNSVYSLGSPTTQWKDLYVSNNTIFINNVPLSANGNVITYDGVPLVSTNSSENISTSGNITGGNLILELSGAIVFPDGSTQTSAAQPYTDANVASFLASGTDTSNIVTTGNISGGYFIGNGSQLTGLPSGYANSDVAAFLASGNDTSNIITTANVSGAYIIGNGSSLTALTGANVTGEVAFAGTANSVAAANVVGSVANATFATTAGTADSVAGANVSGPVGLATFATTANSVAGANVAGEVAHAAVANSVAGANVSGQVSFAATANSVAGGNVVGTVASATTAGTVTTAAQPNITSVGTLTGLSVSGNINAGTYHINNLADPQAAQDAATKAYVDATSSGLSVKGSVDLATTAPLSITYSYDNGVAGVGAFILATTVGQLVIDGVNASVGDRVLIKNEVGAYVDDNTPSAAFNGIYVVLDDGVSNAFQLERSTDCDTAAEIPAAYTLVTGGTTLTNTGWVDDNTSSMVVGTTSINFVQFSSVTTYSGGSAIDVTGTVISAKYDGTTIVTNGSNQLEVGTVPGTSISGTVASATVAASANSVAGANVSGEVGFAAVANLVAGGNVSGAVGLADFATTANSVAGGNVTGEVAFAAVANTVAGANVSGQVANALVAATVYTNAQPNITSVGTLVDLTVTGNVTGDYFIGNGSQLTGLPAGYANSDVANYLASNANVVITTTGNITTTANVEAGFFIGDGSQLTNLPPAQAVSIPAVYFNVVADGNNQTFSNTVLSAYTSNTEITLFYNGALLDSPYYTLSGDTLTINTPLFTGDSIDVIRQFASNVIVSTYSNSDVSAYLASGNDTAGIVTSGNITANTGAFFIGDGGLLSNISGTGSYSNANVANYLPTYTGNLGNVDTIATTGNVTAGTGAFFIGDGGLLSNISGTGSYSNANVANYLPTYTGDLANVNMANSLGVLMGTPTQGSLVSNAVTLTTTTALTNGIALLNNVLGKLVPPSPPQFPASQTLSVSGLATYRMANTSQVDNIPSGGHTVAGGATVTTVKRTAAYATNTIATAGPGDSGTVTALRNEAAAGSVTLTGSSNGTYGNLIITNNQDYNTSNSSIAAGFWFVFSSSMSGTVPAGWNSAQITDTAANSTNQVVWYYDASSPGTPQFSSVTMTPPGSPTVIYSSTVPNYTNVNQFTIGFDVNRLSGDMYPTSDTFATGTAAGAFAAPASRTYQLSSLGTNVLTPNASASVTTTATVISGFGSSATGPTISVVNSYATGTQTLTTALGNTVLYKTGTSSSMEETNITIGSPIGSGTTPAFRIDNPGSGDTPVFTANEPAFNSQTGPLETYDATIVAAILKHDQTNYSTGYLPVGPDLSVGRSGAQYFTFKFVRTATSKFDVKFSGTIAGMWIALPGSVIDTASTLNGWIDASVNYAGSGVPGANIAGGGNGSNGCGLGSTAPLNTLSTNVSTTCTFGTASSSSTATNEIYVRIKLTAGQTVTALSLQTGSR